VQAIPKSVGLRAVPEAVLESLDVLTPTQLAPLLSTQIKLLSRLVTGNKYILFAYFFRPSNKMIISFVNWQATGSED
jgi:hypothetical protein